MKCPHCREDVSDMYDHMEWNNGTPRWKCTYHGEALQAARDRVVEAAVAIRYLDKRLEDEPFQSHTSSMMKEAEVEFDEAVDALLELEK